MGDVRIGRRAFRNSNRVTFLDDEVKNPVVLDPKDPIDAVTIAQRNRMVRDGDHEGLVSLYATATMFQVKGDPSLMPKEVIGTREVYELVHTNGNTCTLREVGNLAAMQKDGWSVTGTKLEDIVG
tara:strand:+ start:112 stop:486 length:375 start_codon:yes stop_codon:yes gene_type:complete